MNKLDLVECGERTLPEWWDFLGDAMEKAGDDPAPRVTIRLGELARFIAALESSEMTEAEHELLRRRVGLDKTETPV